MALQFTILVTTVFPNHFIFNCYRCDSPNSYLDRFSEAEKYLESAEKIISVTHGKSHPLYSETLDPLIKEIQIQLKAPAEFGPIDPTLLEMSKSG